jgi:hypothetical protein
VPAGRDQSKSKQPSRSKESSNSAVSRSDKKGRDSDHRHTGKKDAREFDEFNDEDEDDDDAFDLYGDLDDNYGKSGRGNSSSAKDEFMADDSSYRKSSGHTSRGSASTATKEKSSQRQRKDDKARYIFFLQWHIRMRTMSHHHISLHLSAFIPALQCFLAYSTIQHHVHCML